MATRETEVESEYLLRWRLETERMIVRVFGRAGVERRIDIIFMDV
jgi:hypothetical protein